MNMSGTMCVGNGVQVFQLLAAKGAINLESKGIKHSRMNVRKTWAIHLGLKPNAKHDVVIAAIEKKIEEVRATLQPGDITNF
jgi:hypothetical protein